MIFLKYMTLCIIGIAAGVIVSGGVFSSLIAVGLIPRFAGKSHTAWKVFLYEEMVVIGTIVGSALSVFDIKFNLGQSLWADVILILYGTFAGIFVGCLALAIAEMLNSIPIFARRVGFRHGLGIVILFMALGKATGSLLYFIFYMSK